MLTPKQKSINQGRGPQSGNGTAGDKREALAERRAGASKVSDTISKAYGERLVKDSAFKNSGSISPNTNVGSKKR